MSKATVWLSGGVPNFGLQRTSNRAGGVSRAARASGTLAGGSVRPNGPHAASVRARLLAAETESR